MNLNLEILRKRFSEIEENLKHIELAAQLDFEEFVVLPDKVEATMFRLIVVIEAAAAICSHVTPRLTSKTPDSTAECFECLGEAGCYDMEFAKRLAAMTRFRNLLVHRYWGINPAQVHGFLNQSVTDLRHYVACVAALAKS